VFRLECVRNSHSDLIVQITDRDGCPKIINLGQKRVDLFYERKKFGFKPRG
jgi:PHD finger-like domain-containing protein 5A